MKFLVDSKPIIACSSSQITNAAISLIRISGFKNFDILRPFFNFDFSKIKPRYAFLTEIISGGTVLDQVVLTFFEAPHSFTGENILEISCHGNLLNIQRILDLFTQSGEFRLAEGGEFTFRALKNQKMSLSQVEGLDLMLNANSSFILDKGLEILGGNLHRKYNELYETFIKLKASVELQIDFLEDIGQENAQKQFDNHFLAFKKVINSLHKRTEGPQNSLSEPDIVLVGQPNAGKSSLFNWICGESRSIVSQAPGTTRDYVSELQNYKGVNFKVIDTAGIRLTSDLIEEEGVNRSKALIERAFFKVLVVNPLESDPGWFTEIRSIDFDLLVLSHADDPSFTGAWALLKNSLPISTHLIISDLSGGESGSIGPDVHGPMGANLQSGSIGPGGDGSMGATLNGPTGADEVFRLATEKYKELIKSNPIPLARHREAINSICLNLEHFERSLREVDDIAIISSEVNLIGHEIRALIGVISPDEVLNDIFTNFCIGK